MKLGIFACLIAAVAAGRLENTYLPPFSAQGAGGSGHYLNTPFNGAKFGPSASSYKSSGSFQGSSGSYQQNYNAGPQIGIVRYDNNNDGLGSYSYEYETQNHIRAQENGELRNPGTDHEANAVQGSYSYTGLDGVTITVNYIADEDGFRAVGDHLPTPPPIPDAIAKSIQFNEANPGDDGRYNNAGENNGQYRSPAFSNQYIPPSQPSFNKNSGYRY